MSIRREPWGEAGAHPVDLYTLTSASGMEVSVATYGGVVVRLVLPDGTGVTHGYDALDGYLADPCYFGCLVGRVGNRIGNARFTLDGVEYALDQNHGRHHLHGGAKGFHTRVWEAEAGETPDGPKLRLSRTSPEGEGGYPGTVEARVEYTLLENGLRLDFFATVDKATPVSMTNHSYFNLSGDLGASCLGHRLAIPAGRILETDADLIPTGALMDVTGTPFDFRDGAAVGARIGEDHPALLAGRGYDHYFVLDDVFGGLAKGAEAVDPASGRTLTVWTTAPGVQFYSGNHIPAGLSGRDGVCYGPCCGFCLETQGFVDAPNRPEFPPVTLKAGTAGKLTIMYTFIA
ncbi:MAG: galactose mutarotase [Desulfovibrionaceae bacterium]|nr:galactose mutarotase [Desulfovibrionaceae bacterium]